MSKMMNRAFAGAIFAAAALSAGAANAAPVTASATARANILQQITVTNTSDLDFGTIVSGAAASTVDVSLAGARTCGVGLTCTGATTAADFDITGTRNTFVTVVGDNGVLLTNVAGDTMTASLIRSGAVGNLGVTGTIVLSVGGTLSLAANQADGVYTGLFNVTVNYQ